MTTSNKKLINVSILIFILIISLSTITYAKPLTEALKETLVKINEFFETGEFEAYTKTIDFFFFSILFTSVYLIGVRYAFKEVNKPEKVIAVVLGLMSAFLMISRDYSIISLLPYINWLFYIFLFIIFWLLLKGIKSKFWRFILALFLTLIIVFLVENFLDFSTESEEFSESFISSFALLKNGKN